MKRHYNLAVLFLVALALVLVPNIAPLQAASYPEKPINYIVPWAAGGGSDIMARTIAEIIRKYNFLPQPVVVVNRPGGSGAIGMNEVFQKKGDPYTIIGVVSGQISTPLAIKAPVDGAMFAPISNMAMDEYLLVVKTDSPFKTAQDLIEAAKAKPDVVTVGGSGTTGSEDHISTGLLGKAANVRLKYVPFNSGGEVMGALLGGHIDSAWANPNECLSQVRGGLVRILGVAAPERIKIFPDVPTFKEMGYDAVYRQFRAVSGAPEMPDYAVKTIAEALKKVSETEDWQKGYIEKNGLTSLYLGPEEYAKFLKDVKEEYRQILVDLGVL